MHRALLLAGAVLALAGAGPAGITLATPAGAPVTLTETMLGQLPATHLDIAFETEHGPSHAAFDGPLLWDVLVRAGAIDAARPREQPARAVLVTGSDGYSAVLALGELSPEFESKKILLAERMNGEPLGPDHLRIVVPGDRRGGRSVRDVARITIIAPATPK
jgi:hypothetical protein